MLFRKRKIPCYVLVFDQVEIIKKSLDFMTKYSDDLDLIIIENPSNNTPAIKHMIEQYGKAGQVARYYLFDENITGNAYDMILTKELDNIRTSPFVMVSDGDLTTKDTRWLTEETRILKRHKDIFACGITLDRINLPLKAFPDAEGWIPPDIKEYPDFYEAYTGGHLLLFRGSQFAEFMDWKNERELNFVDGIMHDYCYTQLHMKWSRTKKSKAIHLTWDLYQDPNHPYTKMKTQKSFKDTWYHADKSNYTLVNFSSS